MGATPYAVEEAKELGEIGLIVTSLRAGQQARSIVALPQRTTRSSQRSVAQAAAFPLGRERGAAAC